MKKSIIALLLVLFCFSIAQNIKAAPADIVVFTDNNLKREVNRSLGVSDLEADITEAQIATLSSLKIIVDNVTSISSLEGLQFATNLRTLKLGTEFEGEGVALTTNDITPLGDLTKLDTIALFGQTSFTNFNELKLLNDNAYLDISVNVTGFNSLAGIETMNNIQYLSLLSSDAAGTNLDMSNIENITAIYDLYLDGINITNAATADFSKLVNMSSIAIKNSNITNLNFLKAGMSILNISFNNNKSLTDVSALTNFPDIKSVNLPSNNISDISFLSSFTKLSSISLKGNNISDISVLGTLDLSVINMIELSQNKITDISVFEPLSFPNMTYLFLSRNQITDFRPLVNIIDPSLYIEAANQVIQLDPSLIDEPTPFIVYDQDGNPATAYSPNTVTQLVNAGYIYSDFTYENNTITWAEVTPTSNQSYNRAIFANFDLNSPGSQSFYFSVSAYQVVSAREVVVPPAVTPPVDKPIVNVTPNKPIVATGSSLNAVIISVIGASTLCVLNAVVSKRKYN